MPSQKFAYKVKDETGKTLTGVLEANTKTQAIQLLRNKRYIIISLHLEKESELDQFFEKIQKVSTDDVVNFTRQLSTMITAGLPLTESLRILEKQSRPAMGRIVAGILAEVEGGSSLGDSLEKYNDIFPKVYIALVRAGETAGVLDDILKRLADNLEKQRDFARKAKGALVYPAIILIGMVAVAAIMMIFVVPKMTEMYRDFGATLPLPTRILIGISDFMVKFWWLLVILISGGAYGFYKWIGTEAGGLLYEEALFKAPIIGKLRKQVVLTEFTRTMSLMVGAGISILDSLRIVADAVSSRIFKKDILEAAEKIEKGRPLGVVLADMPEFPPIIPQMISVGEQTGKVDEILGKLSNYFESESETAIKTLTTAIEPLIMVVMGIGVGFLVFAIIMPIYNLTSQF